MGELTPWRMAGDPAEAQTVRPRASTWLLPQDRRPMRPNKTDPGSLAGLGRVSCFSPPRKGDISCFG
jgi:hypothetical protein